MEDPSSVAYPITVSPNGRYFIDQSGRPFFWLGDTAWPLFAQYSREEAEAVLENRSAKGFTAIQGVLAWGGGTGFETKAPGPNFAGEKPWFDDDPATPNDAYFEHVDDLVELAQQKGLVLAMLPTWGYYVCDVQTIHMGNARAYGRWLGARYRDAPNIVWVSGGDRIPTRYESVYRELALGLREGDGGAHLITYHPCGWRSSSQFFHQESWLDFNMIETWTEWYKVHPTVMSDCLLTPVKPVVLGEGAYENGPEYPLGPITPLVVRKQAWWTFLAGGFHTYGQNQMWRMEPGWLSTLDTPGSFHMSVFKRIVTARDWWEWVPDQPDVYPAFHQRGRGTGSGGLLRTPRWTWRSGRCICPSDSASTVMRGKPTHKTYAVILSLSKDDGFAQAHPTMARPSPTPASSACSLLSSEVVE